MKNIKSNIQSGAVKTVLFVAAPIHLGLSVASNLVAELEGRAIQAIDGTPKGQTIDKRFKYTNNKMMLAAMKADEIRTKLQARLDQGKEAIQSGKQKAIDKYLNKDQEEDPTDIVVHATVMPD